MQQREGGGRQICFKRASVNQQIVGKPVENLIRSGKSPFTEWSTGWKALTKLCFYKGNASQEAASELKCHVAQYTSPNHLPFERKPSWSWSSDSMLAAAQDPGPTSHANAPPVNLNVIFCMFQSLIISLQTMRHPWPPPSCSQPSPTSLLLIHTSHPPPSLFTRRIQPFKAIKNTLLLCSTGLLLQ